MKKFLALVILLVLGALVLRLWWPTAGPEADARSRVDIGQGALVGIADSGDTFAWLGIPYADPPTGDRRWRAPRPAQAWQGLREATDGDRFCPQLASGQNVGLRVWRWGKPAGDEDCLYLNVWAPQQALRDGGGRPVLVWIHGGGNTIGHAGAYNASTLAARHDQVVVAINYRLGALGWFSHAALRESSDNPFDASGNYGVLDMVEALRWVRDNIAAFGGDPQRVTLFGQSAGGRIIVALLASPPAAGLFHGAIIQSGLTDTVSVAEAEEPAHGHPGNSGEVLPRLLVAAGLARDEQQAGDVLRDMDADALMVQLRALPYEQLLSAWPRREFGMYRLPQMIRDGAVLPREDYPEVFSDPARHNAVPVITGTNRDEMTLFMLGDERMIRRRFGLFPRVVDAARFERENEYRSGRWTASAVTELADQLSQGRDDVWAYRFDWDRGRAGWLFDAGTVLKAAHGLEAPFVFGDFRTGVALPGVFDDGNLDDAMALSRQMTSWWAAFARDGRPGRGMRGELPEWQPWPGEDGERRFMILDSADAAGSHMSNEVLDMATLKQALASDPRYSDDAQRCETYWEMFQRSRYWNDAEYRELGCSP